MKETGWETVVNGTLNLVVADASRFEGLRDQQLFFERPEDIEHPTNPKIPKKRGGYYYYKATASASGKTQDVLVRRADNPHDERSVELVAPVRLPKHFQITEGSEIEVAVESPREKTTA